MRIASLLSVIPVLAALASAGCDSTTTAGPINYSVSAPSASEVTFQANQTQQMNFGLSGTYVLPGNMGSVTLTPDTPAAGLGFGFTLNTAAFLPATWSGFADVTALPTGAYFPTWVTTNMIDVTIPAYNTGAVDYHVYFGVYGQNYIGIAGVIKALDGSMPAVNVGYTYYNDDGDVALGLQFFGPLLNSDGSLQVPGGVFIGTNLSGLLPLSAAFSKDALAGRPVVINGKSVVAKIQVTGRDARKYRSKKALRGLIEKFLRATRNPW